MNANSDKPEWIPVLQLWEYPSFRDPVSWTVLVDRRATSKAYSEYRTQYALEHGLDPNDIKIGEKVYAQYRSQTDSFASNSKYFRAKVIQNDLPQINWVSCIDSKKISLEVSLKELEELDPNTFSAEVAFTERFLKEAPISPDNFRKLDIGRQFPVVFVGFRDPIGLDGTRYGLKITGDFFSEAHLEWWETGPKELREITTWAAETRAFLTSIINEHNK